MMKNRKIAVWIMAFLQKIANNEEQGVKPFDIISQQFIKDGPIYSVSEINKYQSCEGRIA